MDERTSPLANGRTFPTVITSFENEILSDAAREDVLWDYGVEYTSPNVYSVNVREDYVLSLFYKGYLHPVERISQEGQLKPVMVLTEDGWELHNRVWDEQGVTVLPEYGAL